MAGVAAAVASRRLLRSGASFARGRESGVTAGIKRMLKPFCDCSLRIKQGFLQQKLQSQLVDCCDKSAFNLPHSVNLVERCHFKCQAGPESCKVNAGCHA